MYYAPEETIDALTRVTVDVNPYSDTTTLIFSMESEADHVMTFAYNRITRLISPDCGTETLINGLQIVDSDFDSVRIINPILLESTAVNIEVFR